MSTFAKSTALLVSCVSCLLLVSAPQAQSAIGENCHIPLKQHSEVVTTTLAGVLVDPLSMGEYDHVQKILDLFKKADANSVYAIVETADGQVIATTDPSLKNQRLTRNDFEKAALHTPALALRGVPGATDQFESVMPIADDGGQVGGYLRLGFAEK